MINAHSHAFQLDLRGRTGSGADFWGWREPMYALAAALEPESMRDVSRRAFRAMRAAGYIAVGEFHYVHHRPDGTPYAEPNALALGVVEAAAQEGLERARRVVERAPGDKSIDPHDELLGREAFVLAQLGDTKAAMDLIERYLAAHPTHAAGFKTGSFWGWEPLRADPRWRKLTALAN